MRRRRGYEYDILVRLLDGLFEPVFVRFERAIDEALGPGRPRPAAPKGEKHRKKSRETPESFEQGEYEAACRVLGVDSHAPREVVDVVYRLRAKALHPDKGGETIAMQYVNAAVDVIRKKRGWK